MKVFAVILVSCAEPFQDIGSVLCGAKKFPRKYLVHRKTIWETCVFFARTLSLYCNPGTKTSVVEQGMEILVVRESDSLACAVFCDAEYPKRIGFACARQALEAFRSSYGDTWKESTTKDQEFSFKELEGIHSRTDFDLKAHEEHSGKKLQFFDPEENKSYIPYVIETSIGLDRMFLAVLTEAYEEEKLEDGSERTVMRIPSFLAPVKAAVMPLTKKDGLPEKAREIINQLKFDFNCEYDEKDSIGKRYRRQDAVGTPYCVTVDHQTLEDNTVTIRERDTMEQDRISIENLEQILIQKTSLKSALKKISG